MKKKFFEPENLLDFIHLLTPTLNSTARYVAYVFAKPDARTDSYKSRVRIRELETNKLVAESVSDQASTPCWNPSEDVLAYIETRHDEKSGEKIFSIRLLDTSGVDTEVYSINKPISQPRWMSSKLGFLLEEAGIDPRARYIRTRRPPIWFDTRGFLYDSTRSLYLLDVSSGYAEKIDTSRHDIVAYDFSSDGRRVALLVSESTNGFYSPYITRIKILDLSTGEIREPLPKTLTADNISWLPDGKRIFFVGHFRERGFATHKRLYVLDTETGELELLGKGLDKNIDLRVYHDVRGPVWASPKPVYDDGHIYFIVSDGGRVLLYRSSLKGELEPVINDDVVVDWFDVKRNTIVYIRVTDTEPADLWILANGENRRFTSYNVHIAESFRIAGPERFEFRASDGVVIEGWVMKPASMKQGSRYPAILFIHGGPKSKFGYAFMFEHQLMASKGYVVIYMNPRGSDGYSEEFADIRCRYGERDYLDIMEGLDYVLSKYDFIDPERVGVTGISYGGFMTNWIVSHTDRFKAAISQNGISSWLAEYGSTDIGPVFVEDQICGDPGNTRKLEEKSPITYASTIKTPILILHSMEDYRCYVDQALLLFTYLRRLDREAELVLFKEGSHAFGWTGKPLARIERLKIMLEWFDKHLK